MKKAAVAGHPAIAALSDKQVFDYSVIVKIAPSERPKTSGK